MAKTMPSGSTARSGAGAAAAAALTALATDRARLAAARAARRDAVCAGKPGKPSEYRYAISETCVAVRGTAKQAADAARQRRLAQAGSAQLTAAQNRAEARRLEELLKERFGGTLRMSSPMGKNTATFAIGSMKKMIDPQRRRELPDPERRLSAILKSRPLQARDLVPEHMIYSLVLVHVRSLLQ